MDHPEGPPNRKGRKFGHGTTSQARKERRKEQQWSALEKADPSDPAVLASHLEALEKAKVRCQERMADAVTKAMEQLSTSDTKAGGAKHRGKSGQPRKAVLTPASASASLEKESKKKSTSSSAAKDLEKSKKDLEKSKELEKVKVEKSTGSTGSGTQGLEKAQSSNTKKAMAQSLEKPLVVVDWHNTLEKDEVVSQENIKSLEKLLEHCQVVLLSAVDTAKRRKQVLHDMETMLPSHIHQNLGKEVCWKKCGPGGKADLCWLWEATAIFDDNLQICQECEAWEIDAYQVSYKHPAKGSFPTFVEAVNAFLVDYIEW